MKICIVPTFLFYTLTMCSQTKLILWANEVPNQRASDEIEIQEKTEILRIKNVLQPTLEVYLPKKDNATGKGVIICPGGGYQILAYDWEGTDIAKWLNTNGIAAFVLKYRLPTSKSLIEKHKAPLQDAQRAIRLVRQNAKQWNVLPNKIGIMGFSAGGHLASTLATHYNTQLREKTDAQDTINARPDFLALIYPVITMDSRYTHQGSKTNLLGENPETVLVNHYSNELHVTKDTPPTFLFHTWDDKAVPAENSLLFGKALTKEGVPAEMHLYPEGGHGFSLGTNSGRVHAWTNLFIAWVKQLE